MRAVLVGVQLGVLGWLMHVLSPVLATVHAEPAARPALSWARGPGADGCIAAAELGKAVEEQVQREVLVAAPRAELHVEGTVGTDLSNSVTQGYRVVLRLFDATGVAQGTREITTTNADCRSLDPLLVFVIALLIDPDAPLIPPALPEGLAAGTHQMLEDLFGAEPTVPDLSMAKPAEKPAEEPAEKPAPSKTPPAEPAKPAPSAPPEPPKWLWASAGGSLLLGLLPTPGFAIDVGASIQLSGGVRFDAAAHVSLPSPAGNAESHSFSRMLVTLGACTPALELGRSPFGVLGCANSSVGALRARVPGSEGAEPTRPYWELALGPELQLRLSGRLRLRLDPLLVVPLVRDRFVVEGNTLIYQVAPVGGRIGLALDFGVL